MIDLLATFITFFAVIDPVGTVPVFTAITQRFSEPHRRRIAFITVFAAAGVLLFFVVAGQLLLTALGIPLSSFQLAGGIILFLFALSMVFGPSKPEEEVKLVESGHETAIYPLAVPSIASPGAILTAVLLTDNARISFLEQTLVTATILAVLAVQLVLLLLATRLQRLIGNAGSSLISRIMGMLLAAVATTHVVAGLRESLLL